MGALAVALQPMLASLTSGVNPDALLFTASAALFLCVARAFRRGLTPRLAAATGAVVALGLLAKLNFLGLVPGAALALLATSARRQRDGGERSAGAMLRLPALALAVAIVPLLLEMALDTGLWERPALGLVGGQGGQLLDHRSLGHHLSYLWQAFLPRLPGMERVFPQQMTLLHWDQLVGAFGPLTARFPHAVNRVALGVAALVVALAARALVHERAACRRRRAELLCYSLMGAGLLVLVAAQYYSLDARFGSVGAFAQIRYLLPLMPLYAATMALAARGGGRAMPLVGTLIVVLAIAHDVWGQLVAVARFYA